MLSPPPLPSTEDPALPDRSYAHPYPALAWSCSRLAALPPPADALTKLGRSSEFLPTPGELLVRVSRPPPSRESSHLMLSEVGEMMVWLRIWRRVGPQAARMPSWTSRRFQRERSVRVTVWRVGVSMGFCGAERGEGVGRWDRLGRLAHYVFGGLACCGNDVDVGLCDGCAHGAVWFIRVSYSSKRIW